MGAQYTNVDRPELAVARSRGVLTSSQRCDPSSRVHLQALGLNGDLGGWQLMNAAVDVQAWGTNCTWRH